MDNDNNLPTSNELARLPAWARVAFAVRCTQRVRPLLDAEGIDPTLRRLTDIAINQTDSACIHGTSRDHQRYMADISKDIRDAIRREVEDDDVAELVAESAASTADALFFVDNQEAASSAAASSANSSVYAIDALGPSAADSSTAFLTMRAAEAAEQAIKSDYHFLLEYATLYNWTDTSLVAPELLGPLWLAGVPQGWKIPDLTHPTYLKIEIASHRQSNRVQSTEFNARVAAFFADLSALHVAMGGNGLRILDNASGEIGLIDDARPIDIAPAIPRGSLL